MRTLTAFSIILVFTVLLAPISARANALSDSWQCAKKAGMSSVSITKGLYKKGEALALNSGPIAACLAQTGPEGQALMVTSSALTALRLAKPSLLPPKQCESRLNGIAAKPFATGLAALLPSGGAKDKLLAAVNSEIAAGEIMSQLKDLPAPVSSVPNQISCGCLLSDSALSLTDVSEITNAVSDTSTSCASALDSLGLGFINDIGSYAINLGKSVINGLSDKWDEWKGQTNPAAPEVMYRYYFGDHMKSLASELAKKPGDWTSPKFMHDTKACASTGQYEYCQKSVPELRNLCAEDYDDHKMSKANANKACDGYQSAMVQAATILSKQYIAKAALPPMIDKKMATWVKEEWLWRTPLTYVPGTYDYDNGNVSGYQVGDVNNNIWSFRNVMGDVLGKANVGKGTMQWDYESSGIYNIARSVVIELGNDPVKANDLAFAAAIDPLRDKIRTMWNGNRIGVARYYLREWYPKPTFGFRFGCSSGNIEAACAEAMESRFDKKCFIPISEHYITGRSGIGFVLGNAKLKSECDAQLQPILAASAKLDSAMGATTANICSERGTRDEQAACNAKAQKTYYECAALALKKGKDDASQCMQGRMAGRNILDQIKKGVKLPGQNQPAPVDTPPSRKP
jgi:hypothetical protein